MYDPNIHHRRSLRLPHFNYANAGAYFVTVCIQDRMPLLGNFTAGEMQNNEAGNMVQKAWEELPEHYPGVSVDALVVMPNHVHGILILTDDNASTTALSLSDVIQRWKSWSTTLYRRGVNEQSWPPFPARLWQRNYYERVVRDDEELQRFRNYIFENATRWYDDEEFVS